MSPEIENPRIDTRGTGNKSENILLAKKKKEREMGSGIMGATLQPFL